MPVNPRLIQLADEFAANRAGLDYLDALCAQEKRDLTPDERALYTGAIGRMDVIATEIPEVQARAPPPPTGADTTGGLSGPRAPVGRPTGAHARTPPVTPE